MKSARSGGHFIKRFVRIWWFFVLPEYVYFSIGIWKILGVGLGGGGGGGVAPPPPPPASYAYGYQEAVLE